MANKKQGKGGVKKHKQRADKTTPNAQTADGQRDKQQVAAAADTVLSPPVAVVLILPSLPSPAAAHLL